MSVAEVQARVAGIEARLGGQAPAAPSGTEFATLLRAQARPLSGPSRLGSAGAPGMGSPSGSSVVARAKELLGTPYVWGAETPEDGFDCSGLVQYVFGQAGVDLPRVSTDQARAGVPVAVDDLAPGDLVFFGRPVDHVGIYAGEGKMVVAPHRGEVVKVQDVDRDAVTAARRVLPGAGGVAGGVGGGGLAGDGGGLAGLPPAGRPYAAAIEDAARQAGVDPRLVAAVAWTESGFRSDAVSGAGAAGLMQLMPATARGLGADPFDPVQGLQAGARYLAAQLRRFGSVDLALAAYNAGPTAVVRAGGVPPYPETQAYVARVRQHMEEL